MWSKDEFVRLTSIKGARNKRGTRLNLIDMALDEYALVPLDDIDRRVDVLYVIIKLCGRYLHGHEKKKGYFLQGRKGKSLQYTRNVRVTDLLELAEAELKELAPGISRGLYHFNQRKALGIVGPSKSLSPGYHNERQHLLAMKGQTPSLMRERVMRPFAGSNIAPAFEGGGKQNASPEVQQILRTDFKTLTLPQYEMLGVERGNHVVQYFNKIGRMDMLAIPDGEGLFFDVNDNPVHMADFRAPKHGGTKFYPDFWMYALDRYGNLFVHRAPALGGDLQDPTGYFNHSSFNAGQDVTCAGFIWIWQGVLRHIDNNSGHYKPGAEDLRDALRFLQSEGCDLSIVRTMDWGTSKMQEWIAEDWLNGVMRPYSEEMERANSMVF